MLGQLKQNLNEGSCYEFGLFIDYELWCGFFLSCCLRVFDFKWFLCFEIESWLLVMQIYVEIRLSIWWFGVEGFRD